MALKDFIASNIKGGISDSATTGVGGLFTGLGVLNIAKSNEKIKETLKLMKDMALFRLAWPLALLGMLRGVQTVMRGIVRDTGSLEAAMRRLASLQGATRQFTEIMKSAQAARRHVAELFQFAGRSNFNFDQVAKASKSYQLLGQNVYSPIEALQTFGDVASATGNKIEDVSSVVSTFFAEVKKGESISSTVEEMRQMGIIGQTTAEHLARMQQDGASTTAMWSEMQSVLSKMKGGMTDASGDLTVASGNLEKAKENLKASFGKEFVQVEVSSMIALTTVIQALTPAITAFGSHLADTATTLNNLTLRFTAWATSFGPVKSTIEGVGNALGIFTKAMVMLGGIAVFRSFAGLFTGANMASRALLGISDFAGRAMKSITSLGSSIGGALGGNKLASLAQTLNQSGKNLMTQAIGQRPAGAPFGPLQKPGTMQSGLGWTRVDPTAMMGALSGARVSALATAAGMRILAGTVKLVSLAFSALGVAAGWMIVFQALAVLMDNLGDGCKYLADGMTTAERSAAGMRKETDRLMASLRAQGDEIRTAEDKVRALASAYDALAQATKEKNELPKNAVQAYYEKHQDDPSSYLDGSHWYGKYVGKAAKWLHIGGRGASNKEKAEKDRKIEEEKKQIESENATPTQENEAHHAARQSELRRGRIEREANYEARMSHYGPYGQLVTRSHKIGEVQKEVDQGAANITETARIKDEEEASNKRIAELQGKKQVTIEKGKDPSGYDDQIAAERARITKIKRHSGSESMQAEGNIEAIDAAIKAANLQATGDTTSSAYKEASGRAGKYLGQDRGALTKQQDDERNKREEAQRVEGNYEGNVGRLSQLKNDQVSQILQGSNPVVSSLARLGLGGNTGDSDMLSIARSHRDISKQILDILQKQQKVTDPQDDTTLFGTY